MKAPVTVKDLLRAEFAVFATLDFNLNEPPENILPHFNQIITMSNFSNVQEYLGERMFQLFFEPQSVLISAA